MFSDTKRFFSAKDKGRRSFEIKSPFNVDEIEVLPSTPFIDVDSSLQYAWDEIIFS